MVRLIVVAAVLLAALATGCADPEVRFEVTCQTVTCYEADNVGRTTDMVTCTWKCATWGNTTNPADTTLIFTKDDDGCWFRSDWNVTRLCE